MEQLQIKVGGMSCGGCVNSVTKALQAVVGVGVVNVELASGQVQIAYDPVQVQPQQLKAAVEAAGYDVV
ncbi:cation transporter [Chitinivorax sp. B]|uniref:heavy-metal-associated domain-containing protein n=1 Tax=Chitinivorax sp. B TaxID=2502235 RepID=UPI0010F5F6CB|nr:cation transporter [Chitinivorax sp. B]